MHKLKVMAVVYCVNLAKEGKFPDQMHSPSQSDNIQMTRKRKLIVLSFAFFRLNFFFFIKSILKLQKLTYTLAGERRNANPRYNIPAT